MRLLTPSASRQSYSSNDSSPYRLHEYTIDLPSFRETIRMILERVMRKLFTRLENHHVCLGEFLSINLVDCITWSIGLLLQWGNLKVMRALLRMMQNDLLKHYNIGWMRMKEMTQWFLAVHWSLLWIFLDLRSNLRFF